MKLQLAKVGAFFETYCRYSDVSRIFYDLSIGAIFSYVERHLIQISRSCMPIFDAAYVINGTRLILIDTSLGLYNG